MEDRKILTAVLYAMRYGVGWGELPQEVGFGSVPTFTERRKLWTEEHTWFRIWAECLNARWKHTKKINWVRGPVIVRNGQYAPARIPYYPIRLPKTYHVKVGQLTIRAVV